MHGLIYHREAPFRLLRLGIVNRIASLLVQLKLITSRHVLHQLMLRSHSNDWRHRHTLLPLQARECVLVILT